MSRNYGLELDTLKAQIDELQQLVRQVINKPAFHTVRAEAEDTDKLSNYSSDDHTNAGDIFYSGQYVSKNQHYRWEPQEKRVNQLLHLDGDKIAKVLSALGHKQRLDILKSILIEPLTGTELVDRLNMGTTGQLYHHLKALLGADLLLQEDRGGKYIIPGHRTLPLLLLLAAASDLLDTSDYIEMTEVRTHADNYLGSTSNEYDPHLLLRAIFENSILEHQAGYCTSIHLFLHNNGCLTVTDNGRGIPVHTLANTATPRVQEVLTSFRPDHASASFFAPDSMKGINIPIVNALSEKLTVEIRREGKVFRQDYKHGIPQTPLLTVGITQETGTSITFQPDRDIFKSPFDSNKLLELKNEIVATYPQLNISVENSLQ